MGPYRFNSVVGRLGGISDPEGGAIRIEDDLMRYWEACEAQVTIEEAIEECQIHDLAAMRRDESGTLIVRLPGEVIA